jgi:hypothetical protein
MNKSGKLYSNKQYSLRFKIIVGYENGTYKQTVYLVILLRFKQVQEVTMNTVEYTA